MNTYVISLFNNGTYTNTLTQMYLYNFLNIYEGSSHM